MLPDRRTFLRRAGTAGLLAPLAASWACDAARRDPAAGDREAPVPEGPPLAPFGADAVRLLDPPRERPVTYLSLGERRVYVDRGFRDWAEHRLAAYVSVTTGLWRIPLPGDDPRVPVLPGDEPREFEEVDLRRWDPAMVPAEGDVRLRLGGPVRIRVDLACAPVLTGDAWIAAGSLALLRRDGPAGEGGREEFGSVGAGSRHDRRDCRGTGSAVRIVAWACPQA